MASLSPARWSSLKRGALARLTTQQRWRIARAQAKRNLALKTWDESEHPRDEDGKFTESGGGGGSSSKPAASGGAAKPTTAKPPVTGGEKGKGKKVESVADFTNDNIRLDPGTQRDPEKQKKFLDLWNTHVDEDPGEFREKFLGGAQSTMSISYHDYADTMEVEGYILNEDGTKIGEYRREMNFETGEAESAYFKIFNSSQGGGIGKQVLKANVESYKEMGLNSVKVHADIDVGGYAWARYGYVPTDSSWDEMSGRIERKIEDMSSGGGGGGGYRAGSWDEMSESQQSQAEDAWKRVAADESYDHAVENWREGGEPLDQAKKDVADGDDREWFDDAVQALFEKRAEEEKPDWPFNTEQIKDAITVSYDSDGSGTGTVTVEFDDEMLDSFKATPGQPTLPGIEEGEPHKLLTEEMRNGITSAIERAFEREAERVADNIEPPDYLRESAQESMTEYWDSMTDDSRYDWVRDNEPDILGSDEDGEREGTGEIDEESASALLEAVRSGDPKAIWLVADSKWGKEILLGEDWYGVIDFNDKETMDRFNSYVGKG
jgi:hypothetical protein